MKATHVESIGLAAGHVHANASPPFALPSLSSLGGISTPGGAAAGFSTPTPAPGSAGASGTGGSGRHARIGVTAGASSRTSPLAAALSAFLLLMAGTGFWFGSGRLADNVLSVASSSCPEGLDRG